MKISRKYHGERYAAVICNGAEHILLARRNSEELTKIIPLYSREKDAKVLVRYEGVDEIAFGMIVNAVVGLNQGKKVDLETLLEK
jgi:hypothetical protein